MCDVAPSEERVSVSFGLSEAKRLLDEEIGTDAFELKVHRFRQKLRRAVKAAEEKRSGCVPYRPSGY
jgi:hypothetical protein